MPSKYRVLRRTTTPAVFFARVKTAETLNGSSKLLSEDLQKGKPFRKKNYLGVKLTSSDIKSKKSLVFWGFHFSQSLRVNSEP